MANEEFKFYKDEDKCETKAVFEDWELNTPELFLGGESTLFDSLAECCAYSFWYDLDGCMERSPVNFNFEFCVDIGGLVEPLDCQNADIYGTVIESAINEKASTGTSVDTSVSKVGGSTLEKDKGLTQCGGSLEGQSFTNSLTGSRPDIEGASDATTEVCGTIAVKAGDDCKDEDCLNSQYTDVTKALKDATLDGDLTRTINEMATTRQPPAPELRSATAANMTIYGLVMPATITGEFEMLYFFSSEPTTCLEKPKIAVRPHELSYETLDACCEQHFGYNIPRCCSDGGGCSELAEESQAVGGYIAAYNQGTCEYKAKLETWETAGSFDSIEDCCKEKFNWKYDDCVDSA